MPSNHFSKLFVIESLEPHEVKTGKILFAYIKALKENNSIPIQIEHVASTIRVEFFSILDRILQDVISKNEYPLIHIECHGSDDQTGIVLANNDFISWEDLKPVLTNINVATQCNLMVVLGDCNGAYLSEIIRPVDRAHCWAMLAPAEAVFPDDLMSSYRLFYGELISTLDRDKALEKLFSSSNRKADYWFITPEGLFKKAYLRNLSEKCTNSAYWNRAREIKVKLVNERIRYSIQNLLLRFKNSLRDILKNTKMYSL